MRSPERIVMGLSPVALAASASERSVPVTPLVEKTVCPSSMTVRSRPCPWRREATPSYEADVGKVSPTVFSTSSAAVAAAQ